MYQDIDSRNIAAAFNPRPLALITVADKAGRYNACTVAWTVPLSYEPPMVGVAFKHASKTKEILQDTGEFVINLCGEEQAELCRLFGQKSGRTYDKHELLVPYLCPSRNVRAPLIKGAISHIECRVSSVHDTGDHALIVADVACAQTSEAIDKGMLYATNNLLVIQRDEFGKVGDEIL